MTFSIKRTILSSTAFATLAFAGIGISAAQETPEAQDVRTLDVVTVTGIRSSLQQARDLKKNADGVQDSIVAEDIGKFPDLNLAESLQRLPGVAINREAGEGRRVSLRGLGPDFTRVQLNGMEVLGNVDSPQDSRGQSTRDRAFDFNIFASELFTRVDVYKSFAAEQDEGGLAGTVGLFTAKPFDYEGFTTAGSVQAGTNTATEDVQPRIAGLLSQNWGDFGALVSVAYQKRETEEQGSNTYRWRPSYVAAVNVSALPAADQAAYASRQLRFARGNRYSVWASEQERLGITGALQWAPTDKLELTLDALYGEFSADRDELHLAARGGAGSTWLDGGTTVAGVAYGPAVINEIRYTPGNEVVYLDISNTNFATETRIQETKNTFQQLVLSGEWEISDRLRLDGLVGTESSDYDIPISDKFYTEAYGGVISDYTRDPFYLYNTYDWDTTDPSNYRAHEIDFREDYQSSKFDQAELNAEFDINDRASLKSGVSFKRFENSGFARLRDNVLLSQWQSGAVPDDIDDYAIVYRDHDRADWIIVDFAAALRGFGVTRELNAPTSNFTVKEETTAAFTQLDFSRPVGQMSLRGNAGLRYYATDITSSGVANIGPVTVESSYSGVLPAANLVLEVSDSFQIRAAASQNINRPGLGALAVNGSVTENAGEIRVNIGNPALDPYESTNFDLGAEWYFGDFASFAVGAFLKDIDGFIGTETVTDVPFSQTGLPLGIIAGITPATNVDLFTRPINYESSELKGLEISGQSDFFFLPQPFDKMGLVANLTLVDGERDLASPAEQAAGVTRVRQLEGLSDINANATLYFETDRWGARVSTNYRSDYIANGNPIGNDQDVDGYNATTYVDASAFYQLTDSVKITFDAINLTNQREEQYSDSARRLYNTTESGTTFLVGASVQFK